MTYTYKYPQIAVTVDILLFVKEKEDLFILLIQRKNPPFENSWAFPGGFVEINETLEDAALRELNEETGVSGIELTQFRAFSAIDRDPRQRTISVVYKGVASSKDLLIKAADDAKNVKWFNVKEIGRLAFDHNDILAKAMKELF
jgi:8-oxo-dGTP diphosphatase